MRHENALTVHRLLEEIAFRYPERARNNIARLSVIPDAIQERIQVLLASLPDPDHALHALARLYEEAPAGFARITDSVTALRYFLTVASYSNFLSEALLRRPEYLLEVVASSELHRVLTPEEYEDRLEDFLGSLLPGAPDPLDLARFRRRQLLRIVLRDVLGVATLSDVVEELSNLADGILEVALRRIRNELLDQYGVPRCELAGGQTAECGFAVIALGKLGGKELNYSSDIDLMFLYSGNGQTDGRQPVSNKEFYKKVANRLTDLLSTYTAEGLCYRVDLRLRPDGRLGEVIHSLDGARAYYKTRGRDWELQMLIKARTAAGDRKLGRELLDFVEPLIYRTTLDFSAVESMAETRDRMRQKASSKRPRIDVKLAHGGIRDIEFLVQCLQRLHGGREPWVRHGGTLFALHRLHDKNFLSDTEFGRLASAYQFLRHLEHRLQFWGDRQIHTLPEDPEVLEILAREMPPGLLGMSPSAETLTRQLRSHLDGVQEIYERVIHAQQPMYYDGLAGPDGAAGDEPAAEPAPVDAAPGPSNLERFLDQRARGLAQSLAQARLQRGRLRFEHFLENVFSSPGLLVRLDASPLLVERAVDLFEHSPYFSDGLIRNPELVEELGFDSPAPGAQEEADTLHDSDALRRYFRRRMLRIQAASVCGRRPIFETLEETSDLADSVITAAYRLALERTAALTPPSSAAYAPRDQMAVIALGRLGMREFDLASDADLVFVIPDADADEQVFWTRVAEQMISLISAYTGDGTIFTVDTRLRPNGREGALVQTEGAYKNYFGQRAEAWEGIAYMKSRAVAGDIERATGFLHDLQEVDWRRYGQAMRSRQQLKQMRARLEKEQGAQNPLKAGRGGFYDIDFALLYLRLKGAGIFYKVLNTPARIDVTEQMGHLEPGDAAFLRDAATFYRAIDHGLRVSTGQAQGDLPTAPGQFEVLTELVQRWTPPRLHNRPLDEQLALIRTRTREYFDRLFR